MKRFVVDDDASVDDAVALLSCVGDIKYSKAEEDDRRK